MSDRWGDFADMIKTQLEAITVVAAEELSPTPGRIILLAPGEAVAHDNCCDGQVWVRLASLGVNASNDPVRRSGMDTCAVPHFLANVELGVQRCAATMDSQGNPPSGELISADGRQSIDDMAALLSVLRCDENVRSVTTWQPSGPEGGCHGGSWSFTMRITNCLVCDG